MTYRFFLVLMEMHQTDPETVELFLDDPSFREEVMRRMQTQGLLDAVVEQTEKQKES